MVEALGFLIVAATALYVAWPLLSWHPRSGLPPAGDPSAELIARRDTLYREIADLDFDHRVGKIDDDDYRLQREDYLEEAAAVLERLDWAATAHNELEPQVADTLVEELELEIRRVRSRNGRN